MHRIASISGITLFAMLAIAPSSASATRPVAGNQEGIIVAGENGTKWCCPGGVKSDKCEKGADSTPVGAACSFASKAVIPQLPPRATTPTVIQSKPDAQQPTPVRQAPATKQN